MQNKLINLGNQYTEERVAEIRARNTELKDDKEEIEAKLRDFYEAIPLVIAGELLLEVSRQIELELNYRSLVNAASESMKRIDRVISDLDKVEPPEDLVVSYKVKRFFLDHVHETLTRHFDAESERADQLISEKDILHDLNTSDLKEAGNLIERFRSSFSKDFELIVSRYNKTVSDFDRNSRELSKAESNEQSAKVRRLRDLEKQLKEKEDRVEHEINAKTSQADVLSYKIDSLKASRTNLDDRIKVSKENKPKHEVIKRLVKSLSDFEKKFKESKKENLQNKITEALEKLLHTKVIHRVEVDIYEDEFFIEFHDDQDCHVDILQLSMGQRQLLASSILYGLVMESSKRFPVFIDSPLQKLDPVHKLNVINNFYSVISKQVILTPIPGEVNETDFASMRDRISRLYMIDKLEGDDRASVIKEVKEADFINAVSNLYN